MEIAIIGAGPSGLTSAKNVTSQGMKCVVYEASPNVGGTWVCTEQTEKDQYGFPIHSSMYKNLRCNLPKEIMGFPDFVFPENESSYLKQEEVLCYINQYAEHFSLRKYIKFNELVTKIQPKGRKWEITSLSKKSKDQSVKLFDAVMVCNGHYSTPKLPQIPGEETFKGDIIHSHFYRTPERYQDRKVLILGTGPSGLDLLFQISRVAASITISGNPDKIKSQLPSKMIKKPKITRFVDGKVEFMDGSFGFFESIIYCTGYKTTFPFLDDSCGIKVDENYVQPLYKQIINIEHPTMAFIGLCAYVSPFGLFDLQARFFCQFLNSSMSLPSKEEMLQDFKEYEGKLLAKNYRKKEMHLLKDYHREYIEELAKLANVTGIPAVFGKVGEEAIKDYIMDLENYRKHKFRILNNNAYFKIHYAK